MPIMRGINYGINISLIFNELEIIQKKDSTGLELFQRVGARSRRAPMKKQRKEMNPIPNGATRETREFTPGQEVEAREWAANGPYLPGWGRCGRVTVWEELPQKSSETCDEEAISSALADRGIEVDKYDLADWLERIEMARDFGRVPYPPRGLDGEKFALVAELAATHRRVVITRQHVPAHIEAARAVGYPLDDLPDGGSGYGRHTDD